MPLRPPTPRPPPPQVLPGLQALIRACWDKQPARRPASFHEVVDQLEGLAEEVLAGPPPPPAATAARAARAIGGAEAALAQLQACVHKLRQARPPPGEPPPPPPDG
jgi:hypothetical protein